MTMPIDEQEMREREEDARLLSLARIAPDVEWIHFADSRARTRWPAAIAARDAAEKRVAELEQELAAVRECAPETSG